MTPVRPELFKIDSTDPSTMARMQNLLDQIEVFEGVFNPEQVKFLVYGESGVGKTVFASTWPDPVFLDIDKGMSSITREVFRIDISTWEDLNDAVEFLANETHPFKTVVLDSLNEMQYLSMRAVVSKYPKINRPYDSLPSQSDYGKMLDDADKMVRWIKSIPLNVVLIAQAAERKYETDPTQPQLIGKATARNQSRMVDIVGYLDKRESSEGGKPKTRVMVFDAVNQVTKDRSGKLPQQMDNPTYQQLFSYWTDQLTR